MAPHDKTIVEVQSLDDFSRSVDGRLEEARALLRTLTHQLDRTAPALGGMPDADYVRERYLTLYDEHIDRVNRLVRALEAVQGALAVIAGTYTTNEQRITADATRIGELLNGVNGAFNATSGTNGRSDRPDGGATHAG